MSNITEISLQRYLKTKGFYKGEIDGIWGRLSKKALLEFLESRQGKLTFNWRVATSKRRFVAAWQLICLESGIEEVGVIDGFNGPNTQNALDILEYWEIHGSKPNWRDEIESQPPLPLDTVVKNVWPLQKDVISFYGQVGKNQTMLVVPYIHKIAWDPKTTIKRFSIHEKCHDSALRVLNRALDHYGPDRIQELRLDMWGGCLNVRKMRGGSHYSMHSWGIAIDYDPERNQLKWGRDRASFAKPEYNVWFDLWEEEGWISLGRTCNYDWMHTQAARL